MYSMQNVHNILPPVQIWPRAPVKDESDAQCIDMTHAQVMADQYRPLVHVEEATSVFDAPNRPAEEGVLYTSFTDPPPDTRWARCKYKIGTWLHLYVWLNSEYYNGSLRTALIVTQWYHLVWLLVSLINIVWAVMPDVCTRRDLIEHRFDMPDWLLVAGCCNIALILAHYGCVWYSVHARPRYCMILTIVSIFMLIFDVMWNVVCGILILHACCVLPCWNALFWYACTYLIMAVGSAFEHGVLVFLIIAGI